MAFCSPLRETRAVTRPRMAPSTALATGPSHNDAPRHDSVSALAQCSKKNVSQARQHDNKKDRAAKGPPQDNPVSFPIPLKTVPSQRGARDEAGDPEDQTCRERHHRRSGRYCGDHHRPRYNIAWHIINASQTWQNEKACRCNRGIAGPSRGQSLNPHLQIQNCLPRCRSLSTLPSVRVVG